MTIYEAISTCDKYRLNNQCPYEFKVGWLSELDGIIKRNVIDTHEDTNDYIFKPYDLNTDTSTELLIKAPYDDIYVKYLIYQIDLYNSEIPKCNNSAALFNVAFENFCNFYNREHLPNQENIIKL